MGEKEWHAFVTVVEEGNITKAAERLFLSQPALSYRIRQVEEAVGNPLLLRNNGGIMLTPEGEIYYQYCRRMLREAEQIKQAMGAISGEIQGTLKIASSINFADYELPVLLRQFTQKYPKVHIQVHSDYSHQVSKTFNAGECMVAIARGDYKCVGQSVVLMDEPYCLICSQPVSREDLLRLPMIRYETDHTISMVIDNWCSENLQGVPTRYMELDSMVTCRHFVREGLGWAILPYLGLGNSRQGELYMEILRDKNGRPLTRNTSLFYNEENMKLIAVKTFVEFVQEYYRERKFIDLEGFA